MSHLALTCKDYPGLNCPWCKIESLESKLSALQADAQRKDEALRHFVACVKSDGKMMFYHGNNLFERYADVIAAVGQQERTADEASNLWFGQQAPEA